jgi:hypothetical protein
MDGSLDLPIDPNELYDVLAPRVADRSAAQVVYLAFSFRKPAEQFPFLVLLEDENHICATDVLFAQDLGTVAA